MKLTRRVPIDFAAIAAESGMTRGRLCHGAGGWCVKNTAGDDGPDMAIITPPAMQHNEIVLKIEGRDWCFYAPLTNVTRDGQEVLVLSERWRIYRGQRRRTRGWRMLPDGVSCCRPGRWGNDWRVAPWRSAETAVEEYRRNLAGRANVGILSAYLAPLVAKHREHGMVILYCYCALDAPCHCTPLADALVKELERLEAKP